MYFGTFQGSLPLRKLWRDMLRESHSEFPQAGEQGRSDAFYQERRLYKK